MSTGSDSVNGVSQSVGDLRSPQRDRIHHVSSPPLSGRYIHLLRSLKNKSSCISGIEGKFSSL